MIRQQATTKKEMGMAKRPIDFELGGNVPEEEIHLLDYLRVIVRRKWVVIIFFCTVMTSTAVFTLLQTPVYQSASKIRIYKEGPNVTQFGEVMSQSGGWGAQGIFMKSEIEVLKSRALALRVVKRLHLELHPEFTGASSSPSIWNLFGLFGKKEKKEEKKEEGKDDPSAAMVGAFLGRISITPVKQTQLVYIGAHTKDRNLSPLMANALAEEYIRYSLEAKVFVGSSASTELAKQLEELTDKLENSEKALYEYAKDQHMVALGETEGLLSEKIGVLNKQVSEIASERIKAESLYVQSTSLNPGYLPAILDSEVITKLEQKYADSHAAYMEELERVQPEHPKARQLQARSDAIAKALENEKQKVAIGIKEEYVEVVEREKGFKRQMDDLLAQKENLEGKLVQYRILKRDMDTNVQLYDALLQRMKETSIASGIEAPSVTIVDRATVPNYPYKPKKKLNLIIGAVVGIFLGLGLAFFMEYLDTSVKSQEDIERKIGLTFLGAIPSLGHGKEGH
jgi:uncharacterized protein involved in exopolysaccharide biosynthesis